ncbi:MAG TPA: hypothetical protein VEK08_21440 [Planctomycetota bacterium]|nr:hypothetical protein [Planctomycetota bacterium]
MAFAFAHQKPGLNRCGAFAKPSRYKSAPKEHPASRHEKENEIWRRVCGIFAGVEISREEKKAGVMRLVRGIRRFLEREFVRGANAGSGGWMSLRDPHSGAMGATLPNGAIRQKLTLTDDATPAFEQWARVQHGGVTVEAVCARFNIPHFTLDTLLKETFSISAAQLVNGFLLRGLKNELRAELRRAARSIWGTPGSLAQRLVVEGALTRRKSVLSGKEDRLRVFRAEPSWETIRGDELSRAAELLAELRRSRELGETAARLGLGSAAKLKEACLTVFGKTLRTLEEEFAREVAAYYLCAEEKVLRDMAAQDGETALTCRARYLYSGDEQYRPEAPFLDRWSAMELRAGWLEAMAAAFG